MNEILKYFDYLMPLAKSLTRTNEEAEDLLQDCRLKILRIGDRYNHLSVGEMRSIAIATVKNASIENRRRKSNKIRPIEIAEWHHPKDESSIENMMLAADIQKYISDSESKSLDAVLLYAKGYDYNEISKKNENPAYYHKNKNILRKERVE